MTAQTGRAPSALAVFLHGRRVGAITRLYGDRHIFAFDGDYVEDPGRATLGLAFKAESGGLVTDIQAYRVRVPPFFSNLLPEGHLRDYLAARAGVRPEREFFLLHALGADLPGAVTVAPADAETSNRGNARSRPAEHDAAGRGPLRFSLAGVQLKFSAVMEAAGGLTVPANGIGGAWIVKLPSARFPAVPQNEFVALELARRIGIRVPRIKLVPVQEIAGLPDDVAAMDGRALVVERFDRGPGGRRIHMEDFAQVFGLFPERKYERLQLRQHRRRLVGGSGDGGDPRLRASSGFFGADRERRHAPEELVPGLRGRRYPGAVAGLRPPVDCRLPPRRPACAHVRRHEGHARRHSRADSPVCGQGGLGRGPALAPRAGDGGRDCRPLAPARGESHPAGRIHDALDRHLNGAAARTLDG